MTKKIYLPEQVCINTELMKMKEVIWIPAIRVCDEDDTGLNNNDKLVHNTITVHFITHTTFVHFNIC